VFELTGMASTWLLTTSWTPSGWSSPRTPRLSSMTATVVDLRLERLF
jgi:hypothetical protein